MKTAEIEVNGAHILADARYLSQIETGWFSPAWWQQAHALRKTAPGRGSAWFVGLPPNRWVLRRYLRGGMIRHVSTESYIFTGLKRTRAWREFHLLVELSDKGFPVPKPVAARVEVNALWYRAELLLEELPAADTLADTLIRRPLPVEKWRAVGRAIAAFHTEGVWHADLNARNILLADEAVYLIDFDRAERRKLGKWGEQNLQRLRRSLDKFATKQAKFHFCENDWQALLAGYEAVNHTVV